MRGNPASIHTLRNDVSKNGLHLDTLGIILQAFLEIITTEIRKVENSSTRSEYFFAHIMNGNSLLKGPLKERVIHQTLMQ